MLGACASTYHTQPSAGRCCTDLGSSARVCHSFGGAALPVNFLSTAFTWPLHCELVTQRLVSSVGWKTVQWSGTGVSLAATKGSLRSPLNGTIWRLVACAGVFEVDAAVEREWLVEQHTHRRDAWAVKARRLCRAQRVTSEPGGGGFDRVCTFSPCGFSPRSSPT